MPSLKALIPFSTRQQAVAKPIAILLGLLLGILLYLPPSTKAQALSQDLSRPTFTQSVDILAINEHGDFILKSGQILRPADLNLSGAGDCERLEQICPLVHELHAYYAQHLIGHAVLLDQSAAFYDRYNRLHAHIQIPGAGWLQQNLLEQGLARVETSKASPLTTPQLLAAEASARAQGKGLWSLKVFSPLSTDIPKNKLDRFQIIEGTVRKTAEVKGVIYLNFGDNWRKDFTIKLPEDMRGNFPERGQELLDLKDRPIRIRGWLFWENGPMITLYQPEQLELLAPN